jgi:tryptophanyl-tRNA synthetase
MTRLSGITPSGHVQLGNYLGAVRRWAAEREPADLFFVSDLHAMTTPHRPQRLRALTREQFAVLLAAGIDPDSLFVQSDLAGELGTLNWILECTCSYGEAARMIQFKEKGAAQDSVRVGLLTYPVLMAADILLHQADEVPVGADQRQHVELARTIAVRFNARYGEVFTVPRAIHDASATRVRDLADPSIKMGKTNASPAGVVRLLDPPDTIRRKIMRAVTDDANTVRYDPDRQPGVSNLLEILAAIRHEPVDRAADAINTYRQLKETVADEVIALTDPIRRNAAELTSSEMKKILDDGAQRARERTAPTLRRAYAALGLRQAQPAELRPAARVSRRQTTMDRPPAGATR